MNLKLFMLTAVLSAVGLLPAYESRYLPLSRTELQRRVLQKKVASLLHMRSSLVTLGSTRIEVNEDGLAVVSGVDRAGDPWSLTTEVDRGGEVWHADLDKNGLPDLIFAFETGGVGLAPPVHLLFVLFDSQGRPVPWQVDGYFETDEHGVKDLLDLNQHGRAQLVRQSYDDGYWITSLYKAEDARWQIVSGAFAGRSYPLYTRFTNRPNRTPVTPMKGRSPREDDLSNILPSSKSPVNLTAIEWGRGSSENPVLSLSDGRSCQPVAWYSTLAVVIDRPNRRDAAIMGASESTLRLLSEIQRRHLPVIVGGHRRYRHVQEQPTTECVPEFIWAEDR